MVEVIDLLLADRLKSFGFNADEHGLNIAGPGGLHDCNRNQGRVLVGPVGMRSEVDNPRLEWGCNIDLATINTLQGIPETHPLFEVRNGVWSILMTGVIIAGDSDEDTMNQLKGCARVDMSFVSSPNFENIGIISKFMQNSCRAIFPNVPPPIVNTVGVAALPKRNLATAVFEFYE